MARFSNLTKRLLTTGVIVPAIWWSLTGPSYAGRLSYSADYLFMDPEIATMVAELVVAGMVVMPVACSIGLIVRSKLTSGA